MQKVVVEVETLAGAELQLEVFAPGIAAQEVSPTRFHAAKDPDQPLADPFPRGHCPGQFFFAWRAAAQELHRSARRLCHGMAMAAHARGQFLGEVPEILQEHAERCSNIPSSRAHSGACGSCP